MYGFIFGTMHLIHWRKCIGMREKHIVSESVERGHHQIDIIGLCELGRCHERSSFEYMNLYLQFCLEEEDVWRCVLAWAKHKAIVSQPTGHWTEEERSRVCQYLSGVMGHVRLLLIGESIALRPLRFTAYKIEFDFYPNRQPSVCRRGRTDGSRANGIVARTLSPCGTANKQ